MAIPTNSTWVRRFCITFPLITVLLCASLKLLRDVFLHCFDRDTSSSPSSGALGLRFIAKVVPASWSRHYGRLPAVTRDSRDHRSDGTRSSQDLAVQCASDPPQPAEA